ncbi:hypothetical protein ACQY0O_006996 [Thecaphora frezii]
MGIRTSDERMGTLTSDEPMGKPTSHQACDPCKPASASRLLLVGTVVNFSYQLVIKQRLALANGSVQDPRGSFLPVQQCPIGGDLLQAQDQELCEGAVEIKVFMQGTPSAVHLKEVVGGNDGPPVLAGGKDASCKPVGQAVGSALRELGDDEFKAWTDDAMAQGDHILRKRVEVLVLQFKGREGIFERKPEHVKVLFG